MYYSFLTFCTYRLFIIGADIQASVIKMTKQPYKRQYRQLDDETKQKISDSSRNKPKSVSHIEHIRQGMLKYWETVPDREDGQWNDTVND